MVSSISSSDTAQEGRLGINNHSISYVKVGSGSHALLLIPGSYGTKWTDYEEIIEDFDRNKYTVVSFDPMYRGKSFPLDSSSCRFILNNKFRDLEAQVAVHLMDRLGFEKFSILGWCGGGVVAIKVAAYYKQRVHKMVIWGVRSYFSEEDVAINMKYLFKDEYRAKLIKLHEKNHGKERMAALLTAGEEGTMDIWRNDGGNICKQLLPEIEARSLVIHSGGDVLCALHHSQTLVDNIKFAELHVMPEGRHNPHKRFRRPFKEIVENFLDKR